jgi:succinate dehydrogenase/fumarate reductase flavoprotein subunit
MVTNCQVFGARAGRFAAETARGAGRSEVHVAAAERPLTGLAQRKSGEQQAAAVLEAVQEATGTDLVVVRSERGLQSLLARIGELQAEHLPRLDVSNRATMQRAIEVENALLSAELMARAALARRSHFREDYPRQDDAQWGVNLVYRLEQGQLVAKRTRLG